MNNIKSVRNVVVALMISTVGLMGFRMAAEDDNFTIRTDKSSVQWKAYKTGGEHQGTVDLLSGELNLSGVKIESGMFVVDMTSILVSDTESPKLHKHLHSKDFFNTGEFPQAKLVIKESTVLDDQTLNVVGDLSIVGKTNEVKFKAKISAHTKDVIIYTAEIKVDRTKYGIDYRSSLGDAFINDEFDLNVKIVGVRSKS